MNKWSRSAVPAISLLGVAIVFSPLVAALIGVDSKTTGQSELFHGAGRPLCISALSALTSAMVALALGVPFAILTEKARPLVRHLVWVLGLLALMVPPYMVAESWIVLLGPVGKVSKPLALSLGFGPPSSQALEVARFAVPGFVFTWFGVGIVMAGCLFPVVSIVVASVLRRTDWRVFEAARLIQGQKGVRRTAVRVLAPSALGAALLVFAAALMEFAVPQVLRVRTIGEAIYERIQQGELGNATWLGLPLLALIVLSGALGALVLMRERAASLAGLEGEIPKFRARPGSAKDDTRAGLMALVALTPGLLMPIISLSWSAIAAIEPSASAMGNHRVLRTSGLLNSLRGAWELARNDAVRTVVLGLLAACLATLFSIGFCRLTAPSRWKWLVGGLGAGLAVPAPVVGLGLIKLWDHAWTAGIYQSLAIVLLAWFARFLPLTLLIAYAALAKVPRELEDCAALAGRGGWGKFKSVILPNAAPGIAAAWLAAYVFSTTEFSATLLVSPPGKPLLAPSVVNLMRRGQDSEIAACQFLLLCVVALPLAVPLVVGFIRAVVGVRQTRTA